MPLCIDTYRTVEEYLDKNDILIQKRICQIYMVGEGQRILNGEGVIDYTVSMRTATSLKTAYIKLGDVPLGDFSSTEEQGIYIEEIPLPKPFKWKRKWPPLEKLVDCDISAKIEEEFGIKIDQYLEI